jgi:hypothetical protein
MIIVIVIAILAIAAAIWMYLQKKRTQDLRSKFGPEYDRAIDTHKDRSHAESDLETRAKRAMPKIGGSSNPCSWTTRGQRSNMPTFWSRM